MLTLIEALGLDIQKTAQRLKDFKALAGRGAKHELKLPNGGIYTLIDDSYSGQPEAMKIAIETLAKNTQKLFDNFDKKIKELDDDLKTYSTIQTRLKNDLASFDMKSFNNGKPIGPIYFDHHSLILTQNYIMGVRTQDCNPNYSIFYYTPEYKEKFDKLLGKTKTAEKRECEVTHPPIKGKIKNLTPHRDTPEEGTYVL